MRDSTLPLGHAPAWEFTVDTERLFATLSRKVRERGSVVPKNEDAPTVVIYIRHGDQFFKPNNGSWGHAVWDRGGFHSNDIPTFTFGSGRRLKKRINKWCYRTAFGENDQCAEQ